MYDDNYNYGRIQYNLLIIRIDLSNIDHNYNYTFDCDDNKNITLILIDNLNLKFESLKIVFIGAKYNDDSLGATFELHNIHSKVFTYYICNSYHDDNLLYNCHFDKQILN